MCPRAAPDPDQTDWEALPLPPAHVLSHLTDAHCHPTDLAPTPEELDAVALGGLAAMSTADDQGLVAALGAERVYLRDEEGGGEDGEVTGDEGRRRKGPRVVAAFGYHPWFAHRFSLHDPPPPKAVHYREILAPKPAQEAELEAVLPVLPEPEAFAPRLARLRADVAAAKAQGRVVMVGEIGLDSTGRVRIPPSAGPGRAASTSADVVWADAVARRRAEWKRGQGDGGGGCGGEGGEGGREGGDWPGEGSEVRDGEGSSAGDGRGGGNEAKKGTNGEESNQSREENGTNGASTGDETQATNGAGTEQPTLSANANGTGSTEHPTPTADDLNRVNTPPKAWLTNLKPTMAHQRALASLQLSAAIDLCVPVSLHCVSASGAMLDLLRAARAEHGAAAFGRVHIDIHSCGGLNPHFLAQTARQFPNVYFSPSVLFTARSPKGADVVRALPRDRILVESDSHEVARVASLVWAATRWIAHCRGWQVEDGADEWVLEEEEEVFDERGRIRVVPEDEVWAVRQLERNWARFVGVLD